jgi:hypothetical protein
MVPKPIQRRVPQGLMQLDKRRFDGADHVGTGIFKNHEPAHEI